MTYQCTYTRSDGKTCKNEPTTLEDARAQVEFIQALGMVAWVEDKECNRV